ncbi:MAG: divergent polysaccharide deacetylase family protein [Epsilonproteobacteria bacterium]|nr:divergent polysaccharide deacetylase family protein [Campylobacterota bacterium]
MDRKFLNYAIIVTAAILISLLLAIAYYIYPKPQQQPLIDIEPLKKREEEVLKKVLKRVELSEIEDYQEEENLTVSVESSNSSSIASFGELPKLAIIIDDVAFNYQVRALKSVGLPLNLSFFPPNRKHPYTPTHAKKVEHYMVHLPLEAVGLRFDEKDTLHIQDSTERFERRIRKIRDLFPEARFINNHTGSRFTANYEAMERLVEVLDSYGFIFVDSRTTPKTKVPKLMRDLGRKYLGRDIFLDNVQNVNYIKKQISKAIKKAQRKGFAIAIGHPHPATIKALKESKEMLNKVKLIYLDEL